MLAEGGLEDWRGLRHWDRRIGGAGAYQRMHTRRGGLFWGEKKRNAQKRRDDETKTTENAGGAIIVVVEVPVELHAREKGLELD